MGGSLVTCMQDCMLPQDISKINGLVRLAVNRNFHRSDVSLHVGS